MPAPRACLADAPAPPNDRRREDASWVWLRPVVSPLPSRRLAPPRSADGPLRSAHQPLRSLAAPVRSSAAPLRSAHRTLRSPAAPLTDRSAPLTSRSAHRPLCSARRPLRSAHRPLHSAPLRPSAASLHLAPLTGRSVPIRSPTAPLRSLAARVRSDGRDHDWHQPRRCSAKPRLDGNAWPDPRGDWAGAVPDVATNELNALRQASAMNEQGCLALAKGAGVTFRWGASVWPKRYLKLR